jgi:hypothetical protein
MRFFYLSLIGVLGSGLNVSADRQAPIDRHALVARHDIEWPSLDGPIVLGNGNFAFNADGTGLQTVGGNTMSHWCWHSFPLPPGVTKSEIKPWATPDHGHLTNVTTREPKAIYDWERANPQPLNLGRIGFISQKGERLSASDVHVDSRHLELWTGILTSHFTYLGEPVAVQTCVDPKSDTVAAQVESVLLRDGRLRVMLDFPAPAQKAGGWQGDKVGALLGDFSRAAGHQTTIIGQKQARIELNRSIDDTHYEVVLDGRGFAVSQPVGGASPHRFTLTPNAGADSIEFTCHFGTNAAHATVRRFEDVKRACAKSWPAFWKSGGAIDLSGSRDPRWMELERRIVLSQYELAAQSAGDYPPAEVGLTGTDPWQAKWHFEMIWWHLAHYALWDRWSMGEKALSIYQRVAPVAKSIAGNFDYKGLMWPKSTGPNGYNDGWPPEMALLWKEPHPIFFAELDYRLHPTRATLAKWKDIVFGTADFMADYPLRDSATGQYNLDPVWPACEDHEKSLPRNTIFELGYWRVGLEMAQQWRLRLGLPREAHWDEVSSHLAPLPEKDGLYIFSEARTNTFIRRTFDHVDNIGIAGMLPPFPGLDQATARRTVEEVGRKWNWDATWGWDFPWMAMAAARVGDPKLAVDALLISSVKNRYDERGICTGGPGPYLPGNGGLLYAVAMMAAGWDGSTNRNAPGFPDDGSWTVRWEGLKRAP